MIQNHSTLFSLKINLLRSSAIIGSILLFVGGPDALSPRSFKHIWDSGHVIFFAILSTLLILEWSKDKKVSYLQQCASVVLISLILGILIEWAQAGSKRTADIFDVGRNVIGALVAISFLVPADSKIPKSYFRILQALTILLVIFVLIPIAKATADEWLAREQFPILSDFETPFEIDRWSGNTTISIDHKIHSHGRSSLKAILDTSPYSGVNLKYFPGNWLNYKYLQLSIFNPIEEPIKITCRIHDKLHEEGEQSYDDRFNKSFLIEKGWNLIKISLEEVVNSPKNRKLNLGQIQGVGIFAMRLPFRRTIYIDNVCLSDFMSPR